MNRKGDWRSLLYFILIVGGIMMGLGTIATKFAVEYGVDTQSNMTDAYILIGNISEIAAGSQDTVAGGSLEEGSAEDSLWRNSYQVVKIVLFSLFSYYQIIIYTLARQFNLPTYVFNIFLVIVVTTIIATIVAWVLGRNK